MAIQDAENSLRKDDGGWSIFFGHYERFDKQRKHQKGSGLNDYSLLGSLLRISDEVRLHSRFLFSMLNPDGPHFRDSVFGEAFMSVLGRTDWLDWCKVRVYREHNSVDLYLTDGKRHVLVENKLNASDQHGQVRRYIDWVRRVSEERETPADPDDVLFVYLSNGRPGPTRASLHPYEICASPVGAYVVDGEQQKLARFMNAHYHKHIVSWISTCLASVHDIENLRNAFMEYRLVVQRITKTYKSRVMNLEAFLLEDSAQMDSRSRIRHAFEIARKLPGIKTSWLENMFEEGLDRLLQEQVSKNQLVPIAACDSVDLAPFRFERRHARLFFAERGSRDGKNKGRFWRVVSGPSSNAVALAVLFGASNLHIGLLPIRVGSSSAVELDPSRNIDEFNLASDGQFFELKRHTPINKVFPGLVSWTDPLDEEIENLATLEGSPQAFIVKALLERVLE
jgi:hypothetical protein